MADETTPAKIQLNVQITGEVAEAINHDASWYQRTPASLVADLLQGSINATGYGCPGRTEREVQVAAKPVSEATPEATPDWMHFINFDGRLTGETAKTVEHVAKAAGMTPHELLTKLLAEALADKLSPHAVRDQDVKVEPMTINAGNGGFHVLTFVTDGYGSLVAEDTNGAEQARVENRGGATLADLVADLMRAVAAAKANPHC